MSSIPTLTRVLDKSSTKHSAKSPQGTSAARPHDSSSRSVHQALLPVPTGRHLLDIPVLTLSEHRAWSSTGHWQGLFDCAIWLRTPQGIAQPLQLFVRYVDNQGEKNVFVDRCSAGSYRTVLLNGTLQLYVQGRVRDLAFYLVGAGTGMNVLVEEWNFMPQQR